MKKVKMYFDCLETRIKKYFFKVQNNDITHVSKQLKSRPNKIASIEELKLTEEYALKYNTTTRWQTL